MTALNVGLNACFYLIRSAVTSPLLLMWGSGLIVGWAVWGG